MQPASWQAANQTALVAALRPVYAALCRHAGKPAPPEPASPSALPLDPPAALDTLVETFALTSFERAVLLLCAGVELEGRFAEACATALGDVRKSPATFGLALAALPEAHWSALSRDRPLRYWRLVELLPGETLASSPLRIDERILHWLAGIESSDERFDGLIAPMPPEPWLPAWLAGAAQSASRALAAPASRVLLTGRSAADRALAAEAALRLAGMRPALLRASDIPAAGAAHEALARQWTREARLVRAGLCVRLSDAAEAPPLIAFLARVDAPVLVEADEAAAPEGFAAVRVTVPAPAAAERRQVWAESVGPFAARMNGALDAIADQFGLDTPAIRSAGATLALLDPDADDNVLGRTAWRIGREHGRRAMDQLARRIEPRAEWDSLVLPEAQTRILRQIAAHVRHRATVLDRWGFAARYSRGLGLTALFAGASGTGKTMAAEVLAHALDLDLYQIDLAGLVSKYIGETEKNLRRVFDAAEDSGAILLFDEADALFGKRSEVKDSHDRYANLEVSYLLQRMEAYRGLAILTTNMRHAIDTAFLRRIRFVVEFPFPDATERARIWQRVFPPETPTRGLDSARLAQLGVAGGVIRNIAMHAAFLAADAAEPVSMTHLLAAARTEYGKLEKPLGRAETEGWE
ncbi:MAG TPA: ATP-binding protein [Acetobacteraceae bacterium]|jgi:hypothetical protein|nr:ATP-binding protein [Acetobacteraceae bacterium]